MYVLGYQSMIMWKLDPLMLYLIHEFFHNGSMVAALVIFQDILFPFPNMSSFLFCLLYFWGLEMYQAHEYLIQTILLLDCSVKTGDNVPCLWKW